MERSSRSTQFSKRDKRKVLRDISLNDTPEIRGGGFKSERRGFKRI